MRPGRGWSAACCVEQLQGLAAVPVRSVAVRDMTELPPRSRGLAQSVAAHRCRRLPLRRLVKQRWQDGKASP